MAFVRAKSKTSKEAVTHNLAYVRVVNLLLVLSEQSLAVRQVSESSGNTFTGNPPSVDLHALKMTLVNTKARSSCSDTKRRRRRRQRGFQYHKQRCAAEEASRGEDILA